jgi:cob(I)alamin adenosyltransferase
MRLLTLSLEEINELVSKMEKEIRAVKDNLFKLCWYMRGGLNIEQAYNLDREDIEVISKLIESNLETTNKTKLPFF